MLFLLTFPLFHVATSFHVQNVSSIGTLTLWVTSIFCRSYDSYHVPQRFIPCPAKGQGMAVAGRYAFIIGVVEAFYQTLGGKSSFKFCNLRRVTMVRWHSFPMLAHSFESIDSPQNRGWCSVGQMGSKCTNGHSVSTQDDCGAGHLRGIAQSQAGRGATWCALQHSQVHTGGNRLDLESLVRAKMKSGRLSYQYLEAWINYKAFKLFLVILKIKYPREQAKSLIHLNKN